LHATGLSHGDLKYYSIRVEKSDPEKIYLTDFNHASLGGAEADRKALHNLVLVEDDNEYLEVICKSLDSGVMDYDFWIPLLRRLAVEGEVRGDKIKARLQEITITLNGRTQRELRSRVPRFNLPCSSTG
jgi:hypothetical protein